MDPLLDSTPGRFEDVRLRSLRLRLQAGELIEYSRRLRRQNRQLHRDTHARLKAATEFMERRDRRLQTPTSGFRRVA